MTFPVVGGLSFDTDDRERSPDRRQQHLAQMLGQKAQSFLVGALLVLLAAAASARARVVAALFLQGCAR